VYALERLESGNYKLKQASSWQPGRHTLGAFRPTEPLKALFFLAELFVPQESFRWRSGWVPPVLPTPH
ncbi:MAG: hypothetical protein V3R56_05080, partial [Xanthomonadales bacterium]